jgi:hypothetical protein
MSSGTLAKVRYTEFSEPPERPGIRTRSLKKRQVVGPSGHNYAFRQKGRPTNTHSQWLPVRFQEDLSYFEEAEGFEIKRER